MTDKINDGGPAFPPTHDPKTHDSGMSLRDYFAGQALANGEICTGSASEFYLQAWFGNRGGITREEITTRQAYNHSDAMIAARNGGATT